MTSSSGTCVVCRREIAHDRDFSIMPNGDRFHFVCRDGYRAADVSGAGSSGEPLDTDLDEMRASEAAMTREIRPLLTTSDCESCQDGTAAVCLLAWSDAISGEESEPYLCQRCLDREFRDARLIAAIDALRAENARLAAERDEVSEERGEWLAKAMQNRKRAEAAEAKLAAVEALAQMVADADGMLTGKAVLAAARGETSAGAALTGDDQPAEVCENCCPCRPGGTWWGHPHDMHRDCGRHDGEGDR